MFTPRIRPSSKKRRSLDNNPQFDEVYVDSSESDSITNNENDQVNRDSSYIKVHFGYRFNDNKPMRKFFGWFEKTLGLDY